MKILVFLCLINFLLDSCKQEQKPKYELPDESLSYITSDSTKVWKLAKRYNDGHRMNMGHCFLAFRMIFNSDQTFRDNNRESHDCGKSIEGKWELTENDIGHYIKINSPLIPEILNIEDTFKYFKVLHLSDTLMILEFRHKQFSNRTTTITDHLVPENINVKNRDFHF